MCNVLIHPTTIETRDNDNNEIIYGGRNSVGMHKLERQLIDPYIYQASSIKFISNIKYTIHDRNLFETALFSIYKMNWVVNGNGHIPDTITVDLRTDTISQPTQAMREAMVNAIVGDDCYGEDPTVLELEKRSAEMLGKEDAVFVTSGTMANLIAIMVHCSRRDSEFIAGDNSHTFRFEQGGPSQIAGVQCALIKNEEDGTFNLNDLVDKIRINSDCHEPVTELIIVENTHNMCGGKVLPLDWLGKVQNIAKNHGIKVHMDGARLMNAAVYQKVHVAEIAKYVDTICFCLSKGLGAPVGSILAGPKSFVDKARRTRKVLGGGWRQAGFLAAAGLIALNTMIERLQEDHRNAYYIAKAISESGSKICSVDLSSVQTNIVIVKVDRSKICAKQIVDRLAMVLPQDSVRVSVKVSSRDAWFFRIVLYWEITEEQVRAAIDKIILVLKELDKSIKSDKIIDKN